MNHKLSNRKFGTCSCILDFGLQLVVVFYNYYKFTSLTFTFAFNSLTCIKSYTTLFFLVYSGLVTI